tara:strand:+ start:8957 stop:9973 length:1017 start_codon:yes stop_codon:yes gene_type:complete
VRTILITGAAGFIGFHLAKRCLEEGDRVIGLDNFNDYYEVSLKESRAALLEPFEHFELHRIDLTDAAAIDALFSRYSFDAVVNLAAQAGVRYSIENPRAYISSNLVGFTNILEACRNAKTSHLIFASSSSVYGANTKMPFSVHDNVDHPLSLYAATKKANELMAHTYANLYALPCTGLRFFTVYGPWGRPDMALFKFTKAILSGEPIDVYNRGKMRRDFTYIDDIVEAVYRLLGKTPLPNPDWSGNKPDPGSSFAPYKVYNIGSHTPIELDAFISLLESELGKSAKKNLLPMQDGDVLATYADVEDLSRVVDFRPDTPVTQGIAEFVSWFRDYYKHPS